MDYPNLPQNFYCWVCKIAFLLTQSTLLFGETSPLTQISFRNFIPIKSAILRTIKLSDFQQIRNKSDVVYGFEARCLLSRQNEMITIQRLRETSLSEARPALQ